MKSIHIVLHSQGDSGLNEKGGSVLGPVFNVISLDQAKKKAPMRLCSVHGYYRGMCQELRKKTLYVRGSRFGISTWLLQPAVSVAAGPIAARCCLLTLGPALEDVA